MKAILVIDMPKDCDECPLSGCGECDALGGKYDGRCPLKSAKDHIPKTLSPSTIEKIVELFEYHLIVWKNKRGEYELKCSKQEAYRWLYELRKEIHNDSNGDRE